MLSLQLQALYGFIVQRSVDYGLVGAHKFQLLFWALL